MTNPMKACFNGLESAIKPKRRPKRLPNLYYILIKSEKGGWKQYDTKVSEYGAEIAFEYCDEHGQLVRVVKDGKLVKSNEGEKKG